MIVDIADLVDYELLTDKSSACVEDVLSLKYSGGLVSGVTAKQDVALYIFHDCIRDGLHRIPFDSDFSENCLTELIRLQKGGFDISDAFLRDLESVVHLKEILQINKAYYELKDYFERICRMYSVEHLQRNKSSLIRAFVDYFYKDAQHILEKYNVTKPAIIKLFIDLAISLGYGTEHPKAATVNVTTESLNKQLDGLACLAIDGKTNIYQYDLNQYDIVLSKITIYVLTDKALHYLLDNDLIAKDRTVSIICKHDVPYNFSVIIPDVKRSTILKLL